MDRWVIATLRKILTTADFKSVKTKFVNQGIDIGTVKQYLEDFKILRDKRNFSEQEKNIDHWGKQPWEEFKNFVDKAKEEKSKTELKRLKKEEGAELVEENDDWRIYKITTFKASRLYGSGTRWCITQEGGKHWRDYTRNGNNSFYFAISKKRDKNDPYYKVAIQVKPTTDDIKCWDATDTTIPEAKIDEIGLFKFDLPFFETGSTYTELKNEIRTNGITEEVSEIIQEDFEYTPVDYIKEKDFVVLEEFSSIQDFAKEYSHTLAWNLKILDGDEHLDYDGRIDLSNYDVDNAIFEVKKRDEKIYNKFLDTLLKDTDFQEYLEGNTIYFKTKDDVVDTPEKFQALGDTEKVEIIKDFLEKTPSDASDAFENAVRYAVESSTQSELYKSLEHQLNNQPNLLFKEDRIFDTTVYVGIYLNDLDSSASNFSSTFNNLGVQSIDWGWPDYKEIVDMLIDYQLHDYFLTII